MVPVSRIDGPKRAAHARASLRSALAVGHRLVGDAGVVAAIGQPGDAAGAAERKSGLRRIAHAASGTWIPAGP